MLFTEEYWDLAIATSMDPYEGETVGMPRTGLLLHQMNHTGALEIVLEQIDATILNLRTPSHHSSSAFLQRVLSEIVGSNPVTRIKNDFFHYHSTHAFIHTIHICPRLLGCLDHSGYHLPTQSGTIGYAPLLTSVSISLRQTPRVSRKSCILSSRDSWE